MLTAWEKQFFAVIAARYRVIRRIGIGGTAQVYLVADIKHDRHVALKVLHPDDVDTAARQRFQREIRIIARMTHPNILALIDSGEAPGLPYFVMPFIPGQSLRDRMATGRPVSIEEAVKWASEIAD